MLDSATLIRLLPTEVRPPLRENDLVFVEGSRVEQDTVYLTVWGYGQREPQWLRYRCDYSRREGSLSCIEGCGVQ